MCCLVESRCHFVHKSMYLFSEYKVKVVAQTQENQQKCDMVFEATIQRTPPPKVTYGKQVFRTFDLGSIQAAKDNVGLYFEVISKANMIFRHRKERYLVCKLCNFSSIFLRVHFSAISLQKGHKRPKVGGRQASSEKF